MDHPAYCFASLAEALILFPAATFTFIKLYQSSKSNFAYILIAFTLAYGLSRFATFIYYNFPDEKVISPHGYASITNLYFYFLLSL